MGDFFIGIGVLLAIIGPLLLIPATWLVYRFVLRRIIGRKDLAVAASVTVVAAAICLSYFPGKSEFDRLCAEHGKPVIAARVKVDGFYRTRLRAYEVRSILDDGTFRYVEAPDPYEAGKLLRYFLGPDGAVEQTAVARVTSAYAVSDTFSELPHGILASEKRIFEMDGERELARASRLTYPGGPFSILLGTHAMASCPDVMTAEGSRDFGIYHSLERYVLGSEDEP
jgi:hypothetical protein